MAKVSNGWTNGRGGARPVQKKGWLWGWVLLMAGTAGAGELPPAVVANAERLRAEGLQSELAMEVLASLTTEVGHRLAGSDGDKRAVVWAENKLRELGFEKVRAEPVMVPHWVRGENSGEITAPFPQKVVLVALGGSVATPDEGLEAEVLRVESLEALTALPEGAARGKIVFIDGKMERTQDGGGYGRAVRKRGAGPVEAAKKGAVGLLIRSAGTSPNRIAHTGGTRYQPDVAKIPAAALSNPDADLLAAQVASGKVVRFKLRLLTRELPEEPSANVIGEIRGREKPDEIVLLGAHLDSWDVGQGAQDDGAGCAIVVAAAKLIAGLPERPRRTLRVVLFANEEFGLSGARAYAAAYQDELARHVAAFEADLGAGKVWSFSSGVEAEHLPKVEAIARLLAPLGITRGDNESRGGADLSPMRSARVPFFGLAQDARPYFDLHHTENDTLALVDPEGLKQNVAAHAVLAYLLAEDEHGFGRSPELTPVP